MSEIEFAISVWKQKLSRIGPHDAAREILKSMPAYTPGVGFREDTESLAGALCAWARLAIEEHQPNMKR